MIESSDNGYTFEQFNLIGCQQNVNKTFTCGDVWFTEDNW